VLSRVPCITLENGRYSSHRIKRLYDQPTKQCDHVEDALTRDLIKRLYHEGVKTVYVGALAGILATHWLVGTNAKAHIFWVVRAPVNRLGCTVEEYGMSVEVRAEAWTSQVCSNGGSAEDTTHHYDTLTSSCGFERHADFTTPETFLGRQTTVTQSTARPGYLK